MFELSEGTVKISPEYLALPSFKAIYEEDKTKDKSSAFKQLSYVFFLCDYKSPYYSYPEEKKRKAIGADIMKDENYKPSVKILKACEDYKRLNETSEMRLLQAWESKIDELADFIAEVDIHEKNVATLTKAGIDTEKIITSVQKLRDMVAKQMTQKSHIRGGKSEALFES